MKFCYQVATPDVDISPDVTALQGPVEETIPFLADLGYDGVEFMTRAPERLDHDRIVAELQKYGMMVSLVCTGEVYGQFGISYMDRDRKVREEAVFRTKSIIDFAETLGANINIGRIRGVYYHDVDRVLSLSWLVDALREICDYAGPKDGMVALENVTSLQTNSLNTVAEAVAVVEAVERDNCRVMMDVFHMNIEEKDMFTTIRDYADHNIHVHLADNNRRLPAPADWISRA